MRDKRLAVAHTAQVNSVTIGSGLLIGDVNQLNPRSRAIAVQREGPHTIEDHVSFTTYPIFQREPSPMLPPLTISSSFHHVDHEICVDSMFILGASTASAIQIGGIDHIDAHARVKHIRILSDEQ
ncbi:spore germination protein GerPE [Halobacillus naozhouensis]|uniref:Spore germination protein GerPE n=1 Tax=Halobacillus naozhouensis TaxID=554880 RepID=A0ABY8J217_9BACI|nr:spore germination protein GerPE [Halobacillus naozhouensis]WFT76126.1 spore germination protein GerPE [Halobacillus naozhouensis]